MRIALAVILVARAAGAEPRMAGIVGASLSENRTTSDEIDEHRLGFGLTADLVARVHERIGVGMHLGVTRAHRTGSHLEGFEDVFDDLTYTPIQLGAGVTLLPSDRLWISPWLGVQRMFDHDITDKMQLAYGVALGGDVLVDRGHRLAVFASIVHARGNANLDPPVYTSFGLGLGYRFAR